MWFAPCIPLLVKSTISNHHFLTLSYLNPYTLYIYIWYSQLFLLLSSLLFQLTMLFPWYSQNILHVSPPDVSPETACCSSSGSDRSENRSERRQCSSAAAARSRRSSGKRRRRRARSARRRSSRRPRAKRSIEMIWFQENHNIGKCGYDVLYKYSYCWCFLLFFDRCQRNKWVFSLVFSKKILFTKTRQVWHSYPFIL